MRLSHCCTCLCCLPTPQLDRSLETLVNRRFKQYMWKKGHSVSVA